LGGLAYLADRFAGERDTTTDYATFFEDVKNAIVQYVPYFDKGDGRGGIDALCVATELESMAYYVAEWSHTISQLKNNYPKFISKDEVIAITIMRPEPASGKIQGIMGAGFAWNELLYWDLTLKLRR
jgi:hypothetical protein